MRLRILFGGIGLTLGLALYAGIVMAVAARLPDNAVVAFAFYAVAGVAWVAPASLATRWMLRAAPTR